MTTARLAAEATDELAARVRGAHAAHETLRVVGSGSWLDAGRPVTHHGEVSVAALSGVVEYTPGDLVLTVRAGTTLAAIAEITAEHGQWLALDPPGSAASTIGATIATATSGPLALGSGTVRDLVLGLSQIIGTGTRVQVGGRVVKNVAGYAGLATGSFGTLGVITEVSVRLHARPACDATFVVSHDEVEALLAITARLGHNTLAFGALEVLNPALAEAVGIGSGGAWVLLARAIGNPAAVQALRQSLAALADVCDADTQLWHALQKSDGDAATLRVSAPPAHIGRTVTQTQLAFANHATRLRVTPHRGTVRIAVPHAEPLPAVAWTTALASTLEQLSSHVHKVVGERLPSRVWRVLPATTVDPISRRIRDAFDPHRIMNRGIFGEHNA